MPTRDDELIALFRELVELATLDEGSAQSFRVRAYENALHAIKAHRGQLESLSLAELMAIDGIGKSTAQKIREFYETGTIAKLEQLRRKYPPELVQLSHIPGLGPKMLARLRDELGVRNVDDLRAAIAQHRLRELKGFGAKTEEKLLRAIERLGMSGKDRRTPIADALPVAEQLVAALAELPEVQRAVYCGSLRRLRETVADVDVVVASERPAPVMDRVVGLPSVREVLGRGDTKTSVVTQSGLQIDVRVVAPAHLGAAMQYFTGSKAHNIKLRQRALARGWTLNEYGLADAATGRVIASATEDDIYAALGLQVVPPPMREDLGEIELAEAGALPAPIAPADLRGDLHVHTDYSGDGRSSLDDVVAAAVARGYAYVAITDHGEQLAINGVSRDRIAEQRDHIARLRARYPQIAILHGAELNIGPDGELDYDAELRQSLDWCIAAVHSHFDLDAAAQTRRLLAAMDDPAVDALGHLTGRLVGRRPGIEFDVDAVFAKAARTGVAIELNAALSRLDAPAELLWRARGEPGGPRAYDLVFTVDSDAHHVTDLDRVAWGVQHAMRGWVPRDAILNTWPAERLRAWIAKRRARAAAR